MGRVESYFPGLDEKSQQFWWTTLNILRHILEYFPSIEWTVALIGFIFNSIHVVVLTRKPMMTTSSFIILIGIGIHDLIVMICIILPQIGMTHPGGW
uniref:G_PROTEIN_RECEP_F1_2 domain-containing protein n=1 Tax=Caenorhabditis tropicalis TaxID=1561998 RepID=A0A1I7UWC1_9PELO